MTTIAASNATPEAGVDGVNFTTADAPAYTSVGYNADNYPASPAILYYISVEATDEDDLVSERFVPDVTNGEFVWPAVVMPAAGTWTAHLRLDADDSSVANVVVTAS